MKKQMTLALAFVAFVLLLFFALGLLQEGRILEVPLQNAAADLRDLEISQTIYQITGPREAYPGLLLTPQDFASGGAPRPAGDESWRGAPFGTLRLFLQLEPGVTYGLSGLSLHYAQTMYIQGDLAGSVGQPGDSPETTVPQARHYSYVFTPREAQVEMLIQYANFGQKGETNPYPIFLGSPENLQRHNAQALFREATMAGGLFAIALACLAFFLLGGRRLYFLGFGLCALGVGLRALFMESKVIPDLFPALSWQVAMKTEYLCIALMAAGFLLFLHSLLPNLLHPWAVRGFYGATVAFALLALITPPPVFTALMPPYQLVISLMGLHILYVLGRAAREPRPETLLLFLAGLVFVGGILLQILSYTLAPHLYQLADFLRLEVMGAGGLSLAALAYGYVDSHRRAREAEEKVAQAEERYEALLAKIPRQESPTARLSDFGLSKRELDVAYLLIDGKSRLEIAQVLSISMGTVNTHCARIYQKTGCGGVSDLLRLLVLREEEGEKP